LLKAKPWLETAPELEAKALFEHFWPKILPCPNEQGDIESANGTLSGGSKNHLALCGSGDFASEAAYPAFFVEEPVAMKPRESVIRAQPQPPSNEDPRWRARSAPCPRSRIASHARGSPTFSRHHSTKQCHRGEDTRRSTPEALPPCRDTRRLSSDRDARLRRFPRERVRLSLDPRGQPIDVLRGRVNRFSGEVSSCSQGHPRWTV